MPSRIVPEKTRIAAKRGFIRTASQSLASSLVLPAGVTLVFTHDALLAAGVGVAGMLVGAVVNGLQSYFSIIGSGVPEDYQA